MDLIPVKDQKGFYRDSQTGANVNTNTSDYQSYIAHRDSLQAEKERLDHLENEIGDIVSEVNDSTHSEEVVT